MRNLILASLVLVLSGLSASAGEQATVKAWPLVYHAIDEEAGTERLEVAWPLIDIRTAPRYDNWSILHLFSRQTMISNQETRTSALFNLVGWVSRDETRWRTWVFPVIWLGRAGGSSHAVVFPLYWRFMNGQRHTRALFPLYYGSSDEQGSTQGYLFLVWRGERTIQSRENLYHSESRSVLPFYWSEQRETNGELTRRHQTLLPIFSREESHSHSENLDLDEWHRSALFLVRWGREESDSRRNKLKETEQRWQVWPLVSRRLHTRDFVETGNHGETTETRALGPVAKFETRRVEDRDGAALRSSYEQRVFPFYFRGGRDYGHKGIYVVLFPFWWDLRKPDEKVQALVPLGARLEDGPDRSLNILGPLFTRLRSERKQYTRYDLLFPLFMVKSGETASAFRIWPLYAQHLEAGQREGGSICWPLVRWEERADTSGVHSYTPVFGGFADIFGSTSTPTPSGKLSRSAWPFFVSKRSGNGWSWWSLPLGGASHYNSPNRTCEASHAGPLGLIYRSRTITDVDDAEPTAKTSILAGAWGQTEGARARGRQLLWLFSKSWREVYEPRTESLLESARLAIWPLFAHHRETERLADDGEVRSQTVTNEVPLLLRSKSYVQNHGDGEQHGASFDLLTIFDWNGILYHRETLADGGGDWSVLNPLWTVQATPEDEEVAASLGGLGYRSERDICGFRNRRLLYRVFRSESNSRRRTWELMPFADGMVSTRGDRSFHILGGLLGYETSPERTRLRIAYLPLFSKRHQTNPLAEDELRTRAERHLAYGLKYLEGANPEHAIVELSLAEPAFGDDASLYEKLGDACSLASGRDLGRDLLEKAAEDIQSFTSDYPSSFQHEMAGRGNLTALFRDRARSAYARARELGGDSALLRRKQIALESDPERTAELYAEALAAFPRDFSLRLDHIAFEQGRFEVKTTQDRDRKAEQHLNALRRLAQDFPKSARAQYELLIHTPWSTETCPRAVERGLAAARLSGMPEYTDILPDRSQEVVDSPRRCLEFALGQMNWLSAQFERDKDYTQAMQWRERHFETKLDWGIAPDTEWERRQAIGSLRRLYEALEIEDQLIPYLERAVADLMPDAERHGWQREIRRLRREASYITTWDTFPVGNQTTTPGRISGRLFDRYVNLRTALDPGDGQTVGCQTTLVSPQDQDVVLHLGFDETVRVELNGTEVFRGQRRIAVADEYRVPVRLKEGRNTLSLTVGNRRLAHGFFLRVADSEGNPIEDLLTKPSM